MLGRDLPEDSPPDKEETLSRVLFNELPPDREQLAFLPEIIRHACEHVGIINDRNVLDFLIDDNTDLNILKRIKEFGKEQALHAQSANLREIGSLINYCGIARALVSHQNKLSRLSYQELREKFDRLAGKSWIRSELRDLLCQAGQYCRKRVSDGQ